MHIMCTLIDDDSMCIHLYKYICLYMLYLLFHYFLCESLLVTVRLISMRYIIGEWLRDQNTMEDTIIILQKEGWMT